MIPGLRKIVFTATWVVACGSSLHSQAIQGSVVVATARPPERIELLLEKDGHAIIRSQTDSSGVFSLSGMPYGAYELVARAEGYEDIRTRVDLSPPPAGVPVHMVTLQLEPKAENRIIRYDEPIVDVSEMNRNYPKRALDDFDRGLAESRKGNWTKAVEHLTRSVREAPAFYEAHNLLGSMYHRLDRFRDAESAYFAARQLNPRSTKALTNLGSLYIREADAAVKGGRARGVALDDALDILDEAVQINPQDSLPFYLLGIAYYKSDFYDAAEKHFKRALDLDARMGPAQLGLLTLYTKVGRLADALTTVELS